MSFPIFRHQQTAQIRMSVEADSKKIENFAFSKIARRPYAENRFQRWRIAVQLNLEPYAFFFGNRKKMIDDFESGFLRIPIDAGDVRQIIKRTVRIIA